MLLFPCGDPGWHDKLQHHPDHRTDKYQRITMKQYYSYRLMVRMPSQLLPHAGGILFQQWVCNAYSRAEANALNCFRLQSEPVAR